MRILKMQVFPVPAGKPMMAYFNQQASSALMACRLMRIVAPIAAAIVVSSSLVAQTSAPAPIATSQVEVELVTLRDGGFYPNKITRPAGKFVLVVLNRSHAKQPQFGITNSAASAIVAVEQVFDTFKTYRLDLGADTYVLADSSHPKWEGLTIVTH